MNDRTPGRHRFKQMGVEATADGRCRIHGEGSSINVVVEIHTDNSTI